jgi:hypothetical protein
MFTAYFDESGHAASGGFVALAGFVARDEVWERFEEAWSTALARHNGRFLHTTDLTNFKREFRAWDEPQRRALMADLVSVIHAAGRLAAVGAVMAVDDFNGLTSGQRTRLRDPFFPLFQEVIDGASLEAYFEPSDVTVRMVCSQQGEFAGSARELFEMMRIRNRRLGSLDFADMRTCSGLQAADLLAFEFARYYRNQRTAPHIPMRWSFKQLLLQQRILNIQYLKLIPAWRIRLQLAPRIVFLLASAGLAALIALPAFFDSSWFAWASMAPRLPREDEERIRRLEREERRTV